MDDDLLADDGQYKDDGLDDLDIDAEAALLGLSDEDNEDERLQNDDQELEFVDEDGNPVSIGENNADLYEVANIESDKLSNTVDEDVLELDLDAELESFQETSDLLGESPTPTKSYNNERQRKENLISLTNRKEIERPPLRRKESQYTQDKEQDRSNKDVSYSNEGHTSHIESRDSFADEFEYDEESEDESIADDHRERFKSERSNIITLTPAKRRTDIPDTLESVISVEETAKVQAFLENEQKRKMRFKGKMQGRNSRPSPHFQRPTQNYPSSQGQKPQFSSSSTESVSQPVSTGPQPRKILINPHFRGIRIPPSTEPASNETQTQATLPPTSYETNNFQPPPVQYSHQEPMHHIAAPPPIYTAPPPSVQYKPPEYPPPSQQPPIQQIPPPTWQQQHQVPELPIQSYTMPPPPVINYGDPVQQPQVYNTYGQSFQNTNYQNPPMLHPNPPQSVNYSQPPPPVHPYTQSFSAQQVNPVSSSIAHTQYSPPPNQIRMQTSVQQHYQDTSMHQPRGNSNTQKPRFSQNSQRFSRPPEKRQSNMTAKHVPMKQPRLEHPSRKTNVHINNSNIREIPLVDSLPALKKLPSANKTVPIVEEEDEKTKELRMKIEEQKLLREQILKRKEERRRQMAAQRLMDLKKRQAEQNKNTVTIIPKNINQNNQGKIVSTVKQPILKPSVKERIGPLNKNVATSKKKIVVVRKKVQQQSLAPMPTTNIISTKPNVAKSALPAGQKIKLSVSSQKSNNQETNSDTGTQQSNLSKQNKPVTTESTKPALSSKEVDNKNQSTTMNKKNQSFNALKKSSVTAQAQKIKNLRLGYRPGFQRPQFSHLQRMPRPRGTQYPSPQFMEPRMPFPSHGPPINDIRMPPRHFQEPRPPLLPFHPSGPPDHGPFHPSGPPDHGPFHPSGPPDHGPFHPPGPPDHGPFHSPGPSEHGPFHRFFPPDMPRSPPFHMRSPGPPHSGPNFRPRGMEPMFHERFPPPQFRNQMPPMRHMLENNMQRFQRPPRFQQQGKQNISPKNSSNKKPMNQPKVTEAKSPTPTPQVSSSSPKPNNSTSKASAGKPMSKIILTRNQPNNALNDKDIPKTQSVSIENLSSSTSEVQLRKLCSAVGVVENIQLLKSERKAVIKFKEPCQALMFQKKYQSDSSSSLKDAVFFADKAQPPVVSATKKSLEIHEGTS